MSRTYTNKSSTTQGGRGAAPKRTDNSGTRSNPPMNQYSNPAAGGARPRVGQPGAQTPTRPQRLQPLEGARNDSSLSGGRPDDYASPSRATPGAGEGQQRGVHHMFAPNEQKRNKNAAIARKEEESLKLYKDSRKLGHVSYVGTVGGGAEGLSAARAQAQTDHRQTVAAKRAGGGQQQWRQGQKRIDDAKNDEHKTTQRQKAERNAEQESDRQRRLDEDRSKKNNQLLDRLEREAKQKKAAKVLSNSAAKDFT